MTYQDEQPRIPSPTQSVEGSTTDAHLSALELARNRAEQIRGQLGRSVIERVTGAGGQTTLTEAQIAQVRFRQRSRS